MNIAAEWSIMTSTNTSTSVFTTGWPTPTDILSVTANPSLYVQGSTKIDGDLYIKGQKVEVLGWPFHWPIASTLHTAAITLWAAMSAAILLATVIGLARRIGR